MFEREYIPLKVMEVPNTEIGEFDLHGLCVEQEVGHLDVPMEDPREQQTTSASIARCMK